MRSHSLHTIATKIGVIAITALLTGALTFGPFVQSAVAASCVSPLGSSQTDRSNVVQAAYQDWKSMYVTQNGAGADLRVQRSNFDNYDTVSEGIAYGMLFATYNNDKATFDGLWAYAQKHTNGTGVMNWRIAADGTTTGYNGATDADEDIALALVAADTTWGGYRNVAVKQINIIKRHQVEAGSNVVKPGDVWGGSDLLNPSYLAPGYYDVFQTYTGDASWADVKAASYRVISSAQNKTTGLVPDWSSADGKPVNGMSANYGYDASRAPLRLASSAAWSCDTAAANLLAPFNNWSQQQDLNRMASSYSLDGQAKDKGDGLPLIAAAAAAATTSPDSAYRAKAWTALVSASGTSYYPDSMRLFGLLIASGIMVNPLTLPSRQSVAPAAPATFNATAPDSTVVTGTDTSFTLTFTAPDQRNNLLVDLELYNASGQKVAQQVYEQQTLTPAGSTYTIAWKPTTTGVYALKAGIFKAGWAQNLKWNDKVATVTVNTPPVVVTPTPSPVVVTPTPAPEPVIVVPTPAPSPTPVVPSTPTQPVTPAPTTPVVQPTTPTTPEVTPPLQPATPVQNVPANLGIWWPGSTQAVSGVQPFKAVVDGLDVGSYDMFWQVDGGQLNRMDSVRDSAPHKLYMVDLQYWKWSGNGRYTINFVAKKTDGSLIAQKSTVITVTN